MRLNFWLKVHNNAEKFWHWVYYKRLVPLGYGNINPIVRTGNYEYRFEYVNSKKI